MIVPVQGVIGVAVREPTLCRTPLGAKPFAPGTIDHLIVQSATHDIGGRR